MLRDLTALTPKLKALIVSNDLDVAVAQICLDQSIDSGGGGAVIAKLLSQLLHFRVEFVKVGRRARRGPLCLGNLLL